MSRVVVGVGASHSTLMNTHWDEVAGLERAERFKAALGDAGRIIAGARPDAVVIVGSNHFRGMWLDLIPAFTIGVGECVASGESGTPGGPLPVDTDLARHLCRSLVADGFDMAFSTRLQIDHGQTHAVQYLLEGTAVPIVPLVVNVFAPPLPALRRCNDLGAALRRAVLSDSSGKRVAVIGSGGLSHRLPWPRWDDPRSDDDRFMVEAWEHGRDRWADFDGRRRQIIRSASASLAPDFDEEILSLLAAGRLDSVAGWPDETVERRGGNGAQELRAWLIMAAACGHAAGRTLAYSPMPEWLTGMAVAVIETEPGPNEEHP